MKGMPLAVEFVVTLLVAWLLVSCASGDGGEQRPPSDATTSPRSNSTPRPPHQSTSTPADATLPPKLPEDTLDVQEFYSPSKNLACHLGGRDEGQDAYVGCLVIQHRFASPHPPAECDGDLMSAVWMDMDDVVTYGMCRGDPFAVPLTTLAYGSATAVGDFACVSERKGVTCWNKASRRGFVVSAESYVVF